MAKWAWAWTGLLSTPNVPNGGRRIPKSAEKIGNSFYYKGRKVQLGLEQQFATMLPTPMGTDGGSPEGGGSGATYPIRQMIAAMLPTPTARDTRSDRASDATMARNSRPLSEISGSLGLTGTAASPVSQRRALLLGLVCWMMGAPPDWLRTCATVPLPRSATPSSRRSRKPLADP